MIIITYLYYIYIRIQDYLLPRFSWKSHIMRSLNMKYHFEFSFVLPRHCLYKRVMMTRPCTAALLWVSVPLVPVDSPPLVIVLSALFLIMLSSVVGLSPSVPSNMPSSPGFFPFFPLSWAVSVFSPDHPSSYPPYLLLLFSGPSCSGKLA